MSEEREVFAARLRREIKRAGMSEAAFARKIDMNPTYLSRVLNDEAYRPEPETILRFAEGLGTTPEEVASWTDIPNVLGWVKGITASPRLRLLSEDEEYIDPDAAIAYVEARPGDRFQEQVRAVRSRLSRDKYERWCLNIFRAWESNSNLAIVSVELSE